MSKHDRRLNLALNRLDSREDSNEALFIGKGAVRLRPGGVRAMMKRLENITGDVYLYGQN